jgi:hypothetical protein
MSGALTGISSPSASTRARGRCPLALPRDIFETEKQGQGGA